ncbi:uncharacterized protein M421DRAFT_92360 [Didymella exigua CBS 183.55]|uniref:DUF7918 domain-containing protein n=1 Tax=Didymella exigua CBS 183.55 TaxID=1150837 RepID=A0A6A5RMY7_9PLEO|nr:uncharacterized protein M421DRAFT_92360 [Didymella exigua CBS 183.55]KAF1928650.1 hypothetical protein M421DRAFT_92360 [Didymella exigua CBS 183.55]
MAVLAQIPGLNVAIVECHYQALNEYEDGDNEQSQGAEEDQRTYELTRYIKSKTGAKFGIQIRFGEAFVTEYGIRMEVRIDGRGARTMILRPADLRTYGGQFVCSYKDEQRNSKRYHRDFQFADLEVGEHALSCVEPRSPM